MKVRPCALIERDNTILTLQYKYGDQYVHMLPGGNVDPGELLPATITRELHEELGITVVVGDLVGLGEVVSWLQKEDVLHCVFSASIVEGEPLINPTQCSAEQIKWIALDEIDDKIFYPNIPILLKQYLEKVTTPVYIGKVDQPEIK